MAPPAPNNTDGEVHRVFGLESSEHRRISSKGHVRGREPQDNVARVGAIMTQSALRPQTNPLMVLTSPDAAQRVLRPRCLLSGLAAHQHVSPAEET
jgi:hypothetical protein